VILLSVCMQNVRRTTWAPGGRRSARGRLGRRSGFACGLLIASLAGPPAVAAALPPAPIVRTPDGVVQGFRSDGADVFLGIPFARPPVGRLRFRPPQPPRSWHGRRAATAEPPVCIQFQDYGTTPPGTPQSEDCLYLDVYRPAGVGQDAGLPVMYWIHGGGYTFGTSAEYDARQFAQRTHTVVVVTRYRLGALGFLALPGLDAEAPGLQSGNLGTLDMLQGLSWVHHSVARFGGDPRNVTIFGQSAGGNAVCVLLASPLARGLFEKAIIESQGCDETGNPKPEAEATGEQFATDAGCLGAPAAQVACLRALPAARLVSAEQSAHVAIPVSGTPVEPLPSGTAIRRGEWNHVPVMVGNVRWEGKFFVAGEATITAQQYDGYIALTYGPLAPQVLARYPASAYPKPFYALAAVTTDSPDRIPLSPFGIACMANSTAGALSGQVPVFRYEFNDPTSATASPPQFNPPGINMSNAHLAELNYLFHWRPVARPLTPVEQPLARQMQAYWGAFAHTGDPNIADQPYWPRYRTDTARTLVLSPYGSHVSTGIAGEHNCAFWARTPRITPPPPQSGPAAGPLPLPIPLGLPVPGSPVSVPTPTSLPPLP
jgi:para-nitrobenzyl esterase